MKPWEELTAIEYQELETQYILKEGYDNRTQYICGYMDDGLSEDSVEQMLIDNIYDDYKNGVLKTREEWGCSNGLM